MPPSNRTTIKVELGISGRKVRLAIPVDAGPTSPAEMLPVFQSLSNSFVGIAVQNAESEGRTISCTKGCGACCRQIVPVTTIEARVLREIVAAMPPERRARIETRFAEARRKLEETGLLERLERRDENTREERIALGVDYFQQKIPCPFLEDESCSIHPDRPIACREYLVTSPAINCSAPTRDTVTVVEVAAKVSNAVAALDAGTSSSAIDGWIPLVLALDWAAENPDRSLPEPGPEILRKMFENLTKQ